MTSTAATDSDARIIVAVHKPYWVSSDPLYLPLQVGATGRPPISDPTREGSAPFARDDEGDSISEKNARYCELTGIWWAWRNLGGSVTPSAAPTAPSSTAIGAPDGDANASPSSVGPAYVGTSHYRRYFRGTGERGTLTSADLAPLLARAPIVVPRRRHYYVETVASHYAHTIDSTHMPRVREILARLHPESVDAFDAHMAERSTHIVNMFIMRYDLFDAYCAWLFPVIDAFDAEFNTQGLSAFEVRSPGRVSEFLLDVWLAGRDEPVVEQPLVDLEPVNWVRKGSSFLAAKFLGRRYESSF